MSNPGQSSLRRLLSIMAHLRDPQSGCEWDRAQDFETIAPYTIEEAYEVADAIGRNGMAEEAGHFDFDQVAEAICAKLEARHPHIFGQGDDHTSQTDRWETLKSQERAARGATSALDGVALALPALMRAEKLQKRAARAKFDWPDPSGPADKVIEEMAELASATSEAERVEEAGDLLFAAVNLVRHYGAAPEDALRAANAKFERRFREMERLAAAQGKAFTALSLDEQEMLWQAAKKSERAETP
jgi:ATP diphosphatase